MQFFSNTTGCSLFSEFYPSGFCFFFVVPEAKVFETLKKKYGRKQINFPKLSWSGAGLQHIETAKKELEEFSFLHEQEEFSFLHFF